MVRSWCSWDSMLLQRCLELCKEAPRVWPDQANDVKAFAEQWMVVAQEMRSIPLDHGVGFVVRGEKKVFDQICCLRPCGRGAKLLP